MVRQVTLFFGCPNWVFPTVEKGQISYCTSSTPLPNPPSGFPVVKLTAQEEFGAIIQLNSALRRAFPDDCVLVLVPQEAGRGNRRTERTRFLM